MPKSEQTQSKSPKPSLMLRIALWAFGVAGICGCVVMITMTWSKIASGHGADSYRTFWLVEGNWFGFAAFLVVLFLALIVGWFLWWRERRQWNDLTKKYGAKVR